MTRTQRVVARKRRFPSRNPNRRQGAKAICSRDWLDYIAKRCLAKKTPIAAARFIRAGVLPYLPLESSWYREFRKLANALATGVAFFPIFKLDGNSKLPFAVFSTLPGYTCPGAEDCLRWCYSFRAWRFPSAFCRQLQNTLFLRWYPDVIDEAFRDLPSRIDVRLYVDGDFASSEEVAWWMERVDSRPDLRVYGYSKSWVELVEHARNGGQFPPNYVLNMSGGSRHAGTPIESATLELRDVNGDYVVRGWFLAVKIDGRGIPKGHERYQSREYHQRVREAGLALVGQKGFSCPGLCGECGAKQHVCGNKRARLPIFNGIH